MRKSSRGNPNHDERGRFCSAGNAKCTSERTAKEYEQRTMERIAAEVNAASEGNMPFYEDDERTLQKHRALEKKYGAGEWDGDKILRKKEVFEVDGVMYSGCVKKVDGNGHIFYEAQNPEGYSRIITQSQYDSRETNYLAEAKNVKSEEDLGALALRATHDKSVNEKSFQNLMATAKANLKTEMPWESDPKYRNNKNGKLLWLMDHPDSKYANPEFVSGLKKIEAMSDMGVSAERRRTAFTNLCNAWDMTEEEGLHFINEEFLQ